MVKEIRQKRVGPFRGFIRTASILILLTGAATLCSAEVITTVELQLLNTISMLNEEEAGFVGAGSGGLSFTAGPDQNVKAELAVDAFISDTPLLSVNKAYVKARFPGFRITMGKSPVSWGPGFAFNAGDVVLQEFSPAALLTSETLRDSADMLTSAFFPLGPFSFLEVLILPPEIDLLALAADPEYISPPISHTRLGARAYFEAGPLAFEPGYLYKAETDTHYPYLGIQGNLLVDWYIAASVGIETRFPDEGERVYKAFILSGGGSYIASFDNGGALTARLETLIYPAGEWHEQDDTDEDEGGTEDVIEIDAVPSAYPEYGILFYPELSWAINDSAAVFVRSIFSPVDMSALTSLGGSWNIFNGFDLLLFISVQGGDETDTYAYGNPGWFSASAGVQYIF